MSTRRLTPPAHGFGVPSGARQWAEENFWTRVPALDDTFMSPDGALYTIALVAPFDYRLVETHGVPATV